MLNSEVVDVDGSKQQVKLSNGTSVPFDKLLLATGSNSVKWDLDKGQEGVYTLRNIADLKKI